MLTIIINGSPPTPMHALHRPNEFHVASRLMIQAISDAAHHFLKPLPLVLGSLGTAILAAATTEAITGWALAIAGVIGIIGAAILTFIGQARANNLKSYKDRQAAELEIEEARHQAKLRWDRENAGTLSHQLAEALEDGKHIRESLHAVRNELHQAKLERKADSEDHAEEVARLMGILDATKETLEELHNENRRLSAKVSIVAVGVESAKEAVADVKATAATNSQRLDTIEGQGTAAP